MLQNKNLFIREYQDILLYLIDYHINKNKIEL